MEPNHAADPSRATGPGHAAGPSRAAGPGHAAEGWEPLHYGHPRMPLSERAKIFSPFDPLKGFREELRRREHLVVERQQTKPWLPEDDVDF